MASPRKFHNMGPFNLDFSIGPKFIVKDMEKSELVFASNSNIVATGMKWEGDQRLIVALF